MALTAALILMLIAAVLIVLAGIPAHAQSSVPAMPTGLTAALIAHNGVTLTWDDPGDDSITGYQVLRRPVDGQTYGDGRGRSEFLAIVDDTGSSATTHTDTSVEARTKYVYRVKAINSFGISIKSRYANVETLRAPPPPTSVPAMPTGLAAESVAHNSVTLTWNDPGDSEITGYRVLRRPVDSQEYEDGQGPGEFAAIVDDTGSSATTYTDTTVEASTRYAYGLKAINSIGMSEVASTGNVETQTAPPDPPQPLTTDSRPNVVLILADDLGWGDIQTNNPDSSLVTPRIDSIAAEGAHFTDAHSPSSACSPTRYGLLTGRYAWRSWLTAGVLNGFDRPLIGPDRATLGTLLQNHGYRTAAIGKWHLGMDFARLSDVDEVTWVNKGVDFDAELLDSPIDHGFDEFFGVSGNLAYSFPLVYIRDKRFLANPKREDQPASGIVVFEEALDRLTEEAVSFVEREGRTEEPFFLYLPLNAPHDPVAPNAHFKGHTGLGAYADFVSQMDWAVGQVLDALDRTEASEDTLVIFTSDNGSHMGGIPVPNHVDHQSNGEWRGGKGEIYEGGHRVPFLMRWPAAIEAGSAISTTVSLTDLYATLADIVGEEPMHGVAPDSESLVPVLRGEAATRGELVVHHSSAGVFALRDGRWKLVFGRGNGFSRSIDRELFDLERNPTETMNLSSSHREEVRRMEIAMAGIRSMEDGALSDDATLRSLSLAGIDFGQFEPDVRGYGTTVRRGIRSVEVMALPAATDASVEIATPDGQLLYGKPLRGRVPIALADTTTTIKMTVISPDKSATATYSVTLTRDPLIGGTPQIGQVLTANTSGITDFDGLNNPAYSFQWFRNDGSLDSDIVGATGMTYLLMPEDERKTIRVRVSFTDGAGNDEVRISGPTEPVWKDYLEGVLTAGRDTGAVPLVSGYSTLGDLGGTLSPDEFVLDGTTYEVAFLTHARESLWLGLYRALPADFNLRVGDSVYRGSESTVVPSGAGVEIYWWPSASPDWSVDDPVQVELISYPKVALAEREKAPVTGDFRQLPAEHDGHRRFSFRTYFSEGVTATAHALRKHVLSVSGGVVSSVRAVGSEGSIWAVSVTPEGHHPVTVGFEADLDCQLSAAVCTEDGRRLYNRMELTVEPREKNPATGAPPSQGPSRRARPSPWIPRK